MMLRANNAKSVQPNSLWEGVGLAAILAAAFLSITLLQTLTTFFIRMYEADVMLGAIGNVDVISRVSLDVSVFAAGLILVHGLLAFVVHGMAILTEQAWPASGRSRHALIVLWFALAVAVILLLNAYWFPRSNAGAYYADFAGGRLGPASVAWGVTYLVAGLALVVLIVALWRLLPKALASGRRSPALYVSTFLVACGAAGAVAYHSASAGAISGNPNIVILGVDSLRLGELRRFGGRGVTPNIDEFLQQADIFSDSTTPLARTFPSWMSILTGRSPRSTGAVFNLIRREDIDDHPTIAHMLRPRNYTSVYATDEVRFANIDESYGFDRVITPPIGAADFLIGQVGDVPLANVVANTRLGGLLLRFLYANRGIAFLYRPSTFIDRLRNELPDGSPLLVAIHLTVAHWPYFHASTPPELQHQRTEESNPAYLEAVQTADAMFGDVIDVLRAKGILDNALVVVLSDHGEALGFRADSLLNGLEVQVDGMSTPVEVVNWGHGQSVLSPVQYQVLLAYRGFGSQAPIGARGRTLGQPASLEDIVPTVLELIGEPPPDVDGISLVPSLRSPVGNGGMHDPRIRFTETDFVLKPSDSGEIEEEDAARLTARLLEVDKTTGWLQWRPAMVEPLLKKKERAALDQTRLLAAMPVASGGHLYLLLDRQSGNGRILRGRPDSSDPSAQRLWDALQLNFAGELGPPLVPTPTAQLGFGRQQAPHTDSQSGAEN